MKIIHVVGYYPPHMGGMEQRVRELTLKTMSNNSLQVFTSNIGCKKGKIKSTKNLKIYYLRAWEFANTPIIPSLFFKLLSVKKDTIVHIHVVHALLPEMVYLASKIKKFPYICHIRLDPGRTGKFGFLLDSYKKIFLKKVLKNAKKIIVLTPDYAKNIERKYSISRNKILVIPNATDFKIINHPNNILNEPIKILFVGRLAKQKNISVLIEAVKILLKKNKDINLNIVGDGEFREEILKTIKDSNLEKIIFLRGQVKRTELQKEYLNSDLFVLSSKEEGFSTTLLEAMATGVPIIASDIPGTRSVIKNNYNGLLIEPTPQKIAKAIEKLTNNLKLRERLVKNGLKEVKKYSWDKIVKQTEQVYKEVLKNNENK